MSHEINSVMLYIHPPTAVIGYIFVIISLIFVGIGFRKSTNPKWNKHTKRFLYLAWVFNLAGLATGMLWAQLAWGAYWTWDPKESVTLILFILVCLSILFYEIGKNKIAIIKIK